MMDKQKFLEVYREFEEIAPEILLRVKFRPEMTTDEKTGEERFYVSFCNGLEPYHNVFFPVEVTGQDNVVDMVSHLRASTPYFKEKYNYIAKIDGMYVSEEKLSENENEAKLFSNEDEAFTYARPFKGKNGETTVSAVKITQHAKAVKLIRKFGYNARQVAEILHLDTRSVSDKINKRGYHKFTDEQASVILKYFYDKIKDDRDYLVKIL